MSSVTDITITAAVATTGTLIKINGTAVATGSPYIYAGLNTGDNIATITLTSADGSTQRTYKLTITKFAVGQNLYVQPSVTLKYGAYSYPIGGISSNQFGITYTSSNPSVVTVNGTYAYPKGAGTATITASQTGSPSVTQTVTILPVDLQVSVAGTSIKYNSTIPSFALSYSGFVNDDNMYNAIQTTPSAIITASANSPAGKYPITLTGGAAKNYNLIYHPAVLTILGPEVTPYKTPNYFTLDATGKYNLQLSDVASVANLGANGTAPGVRLSPSSFDCSKLGQQQVTISSVDGNPLSSGVTFNGTSSVVTDQAGNIYVADAGNNVIRKISTAGIVSTFAGTGYAGNADGPLLSASFASPRSLAIDGDGNLYVGDAYYASIRKLDTKGNVTTFAKLGGEHAYWMATDSKKNIYFIGDNPCVYKVSSTGVLSLFAGRTIQAIPYMGTGAPPDISFSQPINVMVDAQDNVLVADKTQLIKLTLNGLASKVMTLSGPTAICADGQGAYYEAQGRIIRKDIGLNLSSNFVAGGIINDNADGTGDAAAFSNINSMVLDKSGNLIVCDNSANRIRKVTPQGVVTTIAGCGVTGFSNGDVSNGDNGRIFSQQIFVFIKNKPIITSVFTNVTLNPDASGKVVVPDYTAGVTYTNNCSLNTIKITQSVPVGTLLTPNTATTVTITAIDNTGGIDQKVFDIIAAATAVKVTANASPIVLKIPKDSTNKILKLADIATVNQPTARVTLTPAMLDCTTLGAQTITVTAKSSGAGTLASVGFAGPTGLVVDNAGNIYTAELNGTVIRKISPTGDLTVFAGKVGISDFVDGTVTSARFNSILGLAVDAGGTIYATDAGNNAIRKITSNGTVTTLVGGHNNLEADGFGTMAGIDRPNSIAVTANGTIYCTGSNTNVRRITADGVMTSIAGKGSLGYLDGQGTNAGLGGARAMVIDKKGVIFLGDVSNHTIRRITTDGNVSTFAGNGTTGNADGQGTLAGFGSPNGLVFDSKGNLFVADAVGYYTGRIRKIDANANVTTFVDFSKLSDFYYITPGSLAIDGADNLYMADSFYNQLIKITPAGVITKIGIDNTSGGIIDGNIGNTLPVSQSTLSIPVTVLSTPSITSTYNNVYVTTDAFGAAKLPDYTLTATAINNCPASAVTFTQSPAAGTGITFGQQTSVKLMAVNAEGGKDSVTFAVTVTYLSFNLPKKITYGDADFDPGATSMASGNITYTSSSPTLAAIVNGKLHVTGAGKANITASQNGTSITQTIQVDKAVLTIKPDTKTKIYSADNPPFTVSYTGFVNNDTAASLLTAPTVTTSAQVFSPSGNYDLIAGGANALNYIFNYVKGTLTVLPTPGVTSVLPSTVIPGATVVIKGTNLTGVSAVNFGLTPAASFTVNTDGSISAVVGSGSSGTVVITTTNGPAYYSGFTVVPVPVITTGGSTNIQGNGSALLTANPSGTFNYKWYKDGVVIDNANTSTYTATQSGTYTVNYNWNNVTQTSAPITITNVYMLPSDNFKVAVTGASCKGTADGAVSIIAKQSLSYTAILSGSTGNTSVNLTTTGVFNNLTAGTYNLCFTIAGQSSYQQCFTIVVTEPKDLALYSVVLNNSKQLALSLSGADTYNILVNGIQQTTTNNQLTVDLKRGVNHIAISSDKPCQGTVLQDVVIADATVPFPNPFENVIYVNLGDKIIKNAHVRLYDLYNRLVYDQTFTNQLGVVQLNVSTMGLGVYVLNIVADGQTLTFKMIKK